MKQRGSWSALLLMVLLGLSCASLSSYRLTKEDVVALSGANVGDEVIIRHIQALNAQFDLSSKDIVALKKAGVSERVIEAMIQTKVKRLREIERTELLDRGYLFLRDHPWARSDSLRGLRVEDVLRLSDAGLSDDLIIDEIKLRGVASPPSADDLIALKEAGVSEQVIHALMKSGEARWRKTEVHVYYDPYLPLIRRYYQWYWEPYVWRNRYVPYYYGDLSVAHPSYKYYLYKSRRTGQEAQE